MPSRAKAPFLLGLKEAFEEQAESMYQCPFGLGLHFYLC